MAQYIVNPRRAPRAPARCRAEVVCPHARFEAETEDIGSMGCQVVSPSLVRKDDPVRLVIANDKVAEPLRVEGRVAWVSAQAPWRVGIAFSEGSLPASGRWFEQLISAYPGLAGYRRVPDRIPADATVYLGPPPRFLLDFTADEAVLLRAIASGVRIDELMARMRDRWPAAQRALFSLIARQAVTLQRGHAVHPSAWKQILIEIEASLAVESLGSGPILSAPPTASPAAARPPVPAARTPVPAAHTPVPAAHTPVPAAHTPVPAAHTPVPAAHTPVPAAHTPVPAARTPVPAAHTPVPAAHTPVPARAPLAPGAWSGAQPHDPTRVVDLDEGEGPPLEIGAPERARGRPVPDFEGAGGGWRKARARSPEAQAAFDLALEEIRASNVNGAIVQLRRALKLAPGDPEIAQELGKLAFKDRPSGR